MAKDPAARPQTAMELIRGLQSVEQELRLPVTDPILPVSDRGGTPGGDTVDSQAVRAGETTFGRGTAGWGTASRRHQPTPRRAQRRRRSG